MLGGEVLAECRIEKGFLPSLRTIRLVNVLKQELELSINESFLVDGRIRLPVVSRRSDAILVEFPVESASGHWRAWLPISKCREVQ